MTEFSQGDIIKIQIVFVTTYGVESNQYSGIVQKQVTLDDLFKAKEI